MGNKQKQTLLDVSMELKMTSRSLERQSMKLEQGEKNEMKKIQDVSTHQPHLPRQKLTLSLQNRLLTRIKWRTPRFSLRT